MGELRIDYGQREIAAFKEAVASGAVHFDEQSVRLAKQQYDNLIDGLLQTRKKLKLMISQQGFGGFQSGLELQRGFSNKAADGVAAIGQVIDAAIELQQLYLRSAGLLQQADELNAVRLQYKNDADQ